MNVVLPKPNVKSFRFLNVNYPNSIFLDIVNEKNSRDN